jgi:hypothetical protein
MLIRKDQDKRKHMETAVKTRLQSLQFGSPQVYKNIIILPLTAPIDGTFQYRTLGEGLAASDLAVTEISSSGSVPDLMVVNRGQTPVLLVDGEELAGAKQNRVLNTSILLKERSETKIPVSCTEQGRWAYTSKVFGESGHVMAFQSRSKKSSSVHRSLERSGAHYSDQHEVWAEIHALQHKAGSHSPTSAMSDVYKAREEDLRKSDDVFTPVANQVGLLAFISGKPVGLDVLSRAGAYSRLHPKLVRSYTLEGLLEPSSSSPPSTLTPCEVDPSAVTAEARKFLDEITEAEERPFPSIGHGTDLRYRSPSIPSAVPGSASGPSTLNLKSPTITGSALVYEGEVIHAAFFRLDDQTPGEHMATVRRRRDYFRE